VDNPWKNSEVPSLIFSGKHIPFVSPFLLVEKVLPQGETSSSPQFHKYNNYNIYINDT